jgi:ubiquinol-cytochrome c reductase cytochrome c subunit
VLVLLFALLAVGGLYTVFSPAQADENSASADQVAQGRELFLVSCAFCHGQNGEGVRSQDGNQLGPSLVGVGAAAVDFQVGTGRMPMAASGPQAEAKPVQFTADQIADLAAYVATLGAGPGIPTEEQLTGGDDIAAGAELFRINCAMCHNVAGAGGALTEGKFAPDLKDVDPAHVYEAMVTGPQNMPVFNELNIEPEDKANIIAYLEYLNDHPSPGGIDLGNLGPVSEGLFVWIFALGAIVAVTVWLTAKSN